MDPCIDKNVLCIKSPRDERITGIAIILFQKWKQRSLGWIFAETDVGIYYRN